MKIIALLIVLVSTALMSLMAYNWKVQRNPVVRMVDCKPGEFLTGEGKCDRVTIPTPAATTTASLKIDAAKAEPFKLYDKTSTTLAFNEPCRKGQPDTFFTVNGVHGPIVSINECNGHVTVYHPERMKKDAVEFWRILQQTWPQVCAIPGAAK